MAELPELEDLVAAVEAQAHSDDPLERLSAAARLRDDIDDLAEALLDHFVEQAREVGCSWSRIGNALGVSKQAAQQRHTATRSVARRLLTRLSERARSGRGLWTRFTESSRSAVVVAQEEARALNHNYIGTEHILLGLLRERDGLAAEVLASMGLSIEQVREKVVSFIGEGDEPPSAHIPFTPRAKKALELSLREALQLKHDHISTEHILLGLLRTRDGVAAKILRDQGIELDHAREVVLDALAGDG
jgi:hypothetical protein